MFLIFHNVPFSFSRCESIYHCITDSIFDFLANYPEDVIDSLPECLDTGVYYGWASLGGNDVYKMVLSVGWNPFFKNAKKSMVRQNIKRSHLP